MNTSQFLTLVNIFYDNADERIRDKLFMGNPFLIFSVYSCYVVIVVSILPKYMKNRKELNYRKFMACVDAILCTRSMYFLINFVYLWLFEYNWSCQPIDRSDSWLSKYELRISYEFVVTKFFYTLQSVVFVMCKRKSPVATYLLIHHAMFPMMLWTCANFYPGGHILFIGFINSIVHFSVTAMRIVAFIFPDFYAVKYFKLMDVTLHVSFTYFDVPIIIVYLNVLQVFQFIVFIIHSGQLLFLQDCLVPKTFGYLEIMSTILIAMIYKYFVLHLKKKQPDPIKEKDKQQTTA